MTVQSSDILTIGHVVDEMETWRKNKKCQGEAVPEFIWDKVFTLSEQHDVKMLRTILRINKEQYERKLRERQATSATALSSSTIHQPPEQGVTLCEVKQQSVYEPEALPTSTNSMVVEMHKPDGYVMKFHITTTQLRDTLKEFLES